MNKNRIALLVLAGLFITAAPVTAAIPNAARSSQQMLARIMQQTQERQQSADLNFYHNAAMNSSQSNAQALRNQPTDINRSAAMTAGASSYYVQAKAEQGRRQARAQVREDQASLRDMKFLGDAKNGAPVMQTVSEPDEQYSAADMEARAETLRRQQYQAELQQARQEAQAEKRAQKQNHK